MQSETSNRTIDTSRRCARRVQDRPVMPTRNKTNGRGTPRWLRNLVRKNRKRRGKERRTIPSPSPPRLQNDRGPITRRPAKPRKDPPATHPTQARTTRRPADPPRLLHLPRL